MLNTVSSFSAAQTYNKNILPHKNTNPSLKFGNLKNDKFERSNLSVSQPAFKGNVKLATQEIRQLGIDLMKETKNSHDAQASLNRINKYIVQTQDLLQESIYKKIDKGDGSYILEKRDESADYGDFLRDLSHEICGSYVNHRTAAIALWGMDDPDILKEFKHLGVKTLTGDPGETIKKFSTDIVGHINNTTRLYQKFFDNSLDNVNKEVKMKEVFKMVNESLEKRRRAKHISIDVENAHLLDSDKAKTKMGYKNYIIMSNLIENAIKYSEKDTKIKVKFDIKDDKLHFAVEDQGRGILPQDHSKVVGPERGSNVQDVSGTGYGLYRISEILKFANQPKLEITSPLHPEEAVKKGTRIETFLLPSE